VAANTETGQLVVTRSDTQQSTLVGVTVQVGLSGKGSNKQAIIPVVPGPGAIQAAIDDAKANDIIMVSPGLYDEMVIMWKPVRLQGWGEGSTQISAIKLPTNKLQDWRNKVEDLINVHQVVDLLPGQEAVFGGIEPDALFTEEGAGVLVLAKSKGKTSFGTDNNQGARIDGFTISSADTGGGIMVNGYAEYLEISNNRIVNNSGFYGGGIRVGHPTLTDDAKNDHIRISHNHISQNGGLNGTGGGVSMCTGADSYQITDNYICGNFTLGHGGGIGHLGLSDNALIKHNKILFNQSFNQGSTVSGGGLFVGGKAVQNGLTLGAGSVTIDGNLIQGNQAGAGDGGGINLSQINGEDIADNPNLAGKKAPWYQTNILNNMIVNNLAGLAGAGISIQDAAMTYINNNTVANNDSTATAGVAFSPGTPNVSNPQPAGIVSRAHSLALNAEFGEDTMAQYGDFSNPTLVNNIVWHNRSFFFSGDPNATVPVYELQPPVSDPVYDDLAVLGTDPTECLSPSFNMLTNLAEDAGCNYSSAGNIADDPEFVFGYVNGGRGNTLKPGEPTTAFGVPAAFDEGGNFIQVRFGPLTPGDSDYHIIPESPTVDAGTVSTGLYAPWDYDDEIRASVDDVDIGADEVLQLP
jgi:hypothetical protein